VKSLERDMTGKSLERDMTGKQKVGFTTVKQPRLQERDKLKINPKTKTEWKMYYGKLWNEQCTNGEEGIEKELREEMRGENTGLIKMEEYLHMQKNWKRLSLDYKQTELFKYGGSELKAHKLELFNK
jgi:hypothetical protein